MENYIKVNEKVIDSHLHIEAWEQEDGANFIDFFDEYIEKSGIETVNIASLPSGSRNVSNNIMIAFYKLAHKNAFAHGGLVYPEYPAPDKMPEGMDFVTQYKELMEIGFDGMKMLEGKPSLHKLVGRDLSCDLFDPYFAELEKDVAMESASEEKVFLYRRFAEELAALDNPIGLKALGYSAYGGNRAFPCDWVRSRDAITRLFEIETEMPERAFYANTLGYIYYYGRCDGTPDYEKAYKYFSFAAFNGIYEARYKVADMYEKGLGVVTSVETSDSIIRDLYSENIEYIRDGEFNCKFADVALRMGNIAAREGSEDRSPEAAHYYYMQALFAIRRRMECMNYYGDGRVLAAIEGALSKTREELGFKASRSVDLWSLESVLFSELTGGRRLDLVIKRQGACKYKLTFTPHKAREGRNGKRMFITIPALDFSGMLDKLTVTYKTDGKIAEELIGERIVIDDVDDGALISDGRRVLSYGEYRIKASDVFSGKVYRFAAVKLPFLDDYVDYIVLDVAVAVGDKVAVSRFGETHEGVVMALSEKRAHEVSLPIKFYEMVLGRTES